MTSLLDLLRDPCFRSTVLTLWLLPCAIQDRRTRHVSNWLTVPLFILAWPVAILAGHFVLTFAVFVGIYVATKLEPRAWIGSEIDKNHVFVGVYVATKLEPRAGAADRKLMVGLRGCAPLALGIGVLLETAVFAGLGQR